MGGWFPRLGIYMHLYTWCVDVIVVGIQLYRDVVFIGLYHYIIVYLSFLILYLSWLSCDIILSMPVFKIKYACKCIYLYMKWICKMLKSLSLCAHWTLLYTFFPFGLKHFKIEWQKWMSKGSAKAGLRGVISITVAGFCVPTIAIVQKTPEKAPSRGLPPGAAGCFMVRGPGLLCWELRKPENLGMWERRQQLVSLPWR